MIYVVLSKTTKNNTNETYDTYVVCATSNKKEAIKEAKYDIEVGQEYGESRDVHIQAWEKNPRKGDYMKVIWKNGKMY